MRRIWIGVTFLILVSIFISTHGCAKNKNVSEEKLIARINNYELTVDDFRAKSARGSSLEEMIIKNILIQEAQAQNFDKDKAFMKEIESYWEQALLKLLIKEKMKEFSSKITGAEGAAKDAKVQKMLEVWMADLRKHAKVKIYENNLKEIQLKQGDKYEKIQE